MRVGVVCVVCGERSCRSRMKMNLEQKKKKLAPCTIYHYCRTKHQYAIGSVFEKETPWRRGYTLMVNLHGGLGRGA